jgi:signal transduction histidine kinase
MMTAEMSTSHRRQSSVVGSLTVGLVLTIVVTIAVFNLFFYLLNTRQLETDLRTRVVETAIELAGVLGTPLWNFDDQSIARIVGLYDDFEDVLHVRVYDETSNLVYESDDAIELPNEINNVQPIYYEGNVIGEVEMAFSDVSILREQQDALLSTLLSTLFVVIVIIVVSQVLLRRILNRPLHQLTDGLDKLGKGSYDYRLARSGKQDLDVIVDTVNEMARQISDRDRQLRDAIDTLETRVQERTRDLSQARERAEEADRAKSTFLASMSHELRTPLNAIINFSKFLTKGVPGSLNEEQSQLIASISDSGEHLLQLINDVLDMSKIESGSLKLYTQPNINVREIIDTAVNITQPLVADKPVTIVRNLPDVLPMLECDRRRILQVFFNVLSNACKFTDEGTITIAAHVEDDKLRFSIKDTGVGIAPEDTDHVFTAFKQTDKGLRQGGGTGLGMPISKRLIETHHGRLWFESTLGVGTTFYIELPYQVDIKRATAPLDPVKVGDHA